MSKTKKSDYPSLNLIILGNRWSAFLVPNALFSDVKADTKTDVAVTFPVTREIIFGHEQFNLTTIRHELVHAYAADMAASALRDATAHDLEEFFAELVGLYGNQVCKQALTIYRAFKDLAV